MAVGDTLSTTQWALLISLPSALTGAVAARAVFGRSLTTALVVLVLTPTAATLAGLAGAAALTPGPVTVGGVAVVGSAAAVVTVVAAALLARGHTNRGGSAQQRRATEHAAEQSRRRLVAFLSHDLRTPLAGIRAVSEAIADGVVGGEAEVRAHARHIGNESVRLSALVDDLFEMSKVQAGAMAPADDRVALDEVVDDVLAAHRITAERAGVVLRASLPEVPVQVRGSDRALVRVLSNLVANAIAHTPAGGTVQLALGTDEDGAWARVDDTGVGIDEADLPRVFDVAYRGTNGRVPRNDAPLPSGSGLGLAIAAGLVQAHQGTLSAQNLVTGARFEMRLPLAVEDDEPAAALPAETDEMAGSSPTFPPIRRFGR